MCRLTWSLIMEGESKPWSEQQVNFTFSRVRCDLKSVCLEIFRQFLQFVRVCAEVFRVRGWVSACILYSVISSISPNELFDQSNIVRRRRRWGSETQSQAQRSGDFEYQIEIGFNNVARLWTSRTLKLLFKAFLSQVERLRAELEDSQRLVNSLRWVQTTNNKHHHHP